MTQRLRRKSIRQPGPVKGDQTWAGVGWEDGNGEGVEERERWPRSGDCRNEGEGRREGGWRGLRCRRRAVRGRGQGRGGDNDTHQTHKSCGHRGACRHTQSLTPPHPAPRHAGNRDGHVCGGSQGLFQSQPYRHPIPLPTLILSPLNRARARAGTRARTHTPARTHTHTHVLSLYNQQWLLPSISGLTFPEENPSALRRKRWGERGKRRWGQGKGIEPGAG